MQLEPPEPVEVRVPLFESVVGDLADRGRVVVMDLGRARSGTVALFSTLRCRLDVLDIARQLPDIPVGEDDADPPAWLDTTLMRKSDEPVDLILCWNLLNYLAPDAIGHLMQCLSRRATHGTRVHALIEYSSKQMPAEPWSFAPAGDGRLVAQPEDDALIPAPRYSSRDLEKRMPGFAHERTMLLGNGMQEYLFRSTA